MLSGPSLATSIQLKPVPLASSAEGRTPVHSHRYWAPSVKWVGGPPPELTRLPASTWYGSNDIFFPFFYFFFDVERMRAERLGQLGPTWIRNYCREHVARPLGKKQ